MRILIIEDEIPAANKLKKLIHDYDGAYTILEIVTSNASLVKWFNINPEPDIIFSDIELLDGPVFNSLSQLKISTPIVFTTAYNQFMRDAFDSNGISYLLKPYASKDVAAALEKYKRLIYSGSSQDLSTLLNQLEAITTSVNYKSRLTVRKGQSMYLLEVNDVKYFSMEGGNLYAKDNEGRRHVLSMGLTDLYQQLNPQQFFMINRSDCLSLNFIERMEAYGKDRLAVFVKGESDSFITSAARTSDFRKWINN